MARYRDAIFWIAANDDTEFLNDDDADMSISVTCAFIVDLFNKPQSQVIADIRAELKRQEKDNAK